MVKEDKLKLVAMFSAIQSMNNGAIKLFSINHDENTNNSDDNQFILPSAVLSAFTCELCLKAILIIEGQEIKKIHNLEKLFNLLNPEYKKEIKKNTILHLSKRSKNNDPVNFETELCSIANDFVDLRYFFQDIESTSFYLTNYDFLIFFKLAVLQKFTEVENKYANEMNSELSLPNE